MPNKRTPAKFEDIWQELIVEPLKQISIVNGYENDACWIDGWLLYYAVDITRGINGLFWPSIGVRSGIEDITMQQRGQRHDPYESQNNRSFMIEVGFDAINDRDTLNQRMESLLRDIKRAIGTVRTSNLTLTRVNFMIPEDSLDYAFLTVEGSITFNEVWD